MSTRHPPPDRPVRLPSVRGTVDSRSGKPWRTWRRILSRTVLLALLAPLLAIVAARFVDPPVTPLMVIRLIQGYGLKRQWTAYEDIAPALPRAVIASEDNLFCQEALGFDFAALWTQIEAWQDGDRPRGASTITMQTVKNLMLWPGRDPIRKVLEAWLTPQVALIWPKRRVLEVYLNIVEFGPGIYGAEAAAQAYFRKKASALSAHEAALLAAVLPLPLKWSAASPSPHVRARATVIAGRVGSIQPLLACAQ